MKKLWIIAIILICASLARAQTHTFPAEDTDNVFTGQNSFPTIKLNGYTVATLPAPSAVNAGTLALVTDSSVGCTTGGGFTITLCRDVSQSSWVVVGSAGSGSGHVIEVNGSVFATQPILNFVNGTGTTVVGTNDSGSTRTNVTFNATGGITCATTRILFGTSTTTAGCDANLVWDNTNKLVDLGPAGNPNLILSGAATPNPNLGIVGVYPNSPNGYTTTFNQVRGLSTDLYSGAEGAAATLADTSILYAANCGNTNGSRCYGISMDVSVDATSGQNTHSVGKQATGALITTEANLANGQSAGLTTVDTCTGASCASNGYVGQTTCTGNSCTSIAGYLNATCSGTPCTATALGMDAGDVQLLGQAGTSGQFFTSQGTGLLPAWTSANYQTTQANSVSVAVQPRINFINGTGTTASCANNGGNTSTDCKFDVTGTGTIGGSIANTQVAVGSGTNTIAGSSSFTAASGVVVASASLSAPVMLLPETTAPSGVASKAVLYENSSSHTLFLSRNNGTFLPVITASGTITPGNCAQFSDAVTVADAGVTCNGSGGSSGTVTSVSSGNLSPLFTVSVATPTVTPAFTFALSNAAAHTFYMNNTGGSAAPGFQTAAEADLPATTVWTDQDATFGAHVYDASAVTSWKLKTGAGYAPTTDGLIGFNTTSHLPVFGFNGASTTTIPVTVAAVSGTFLTGYSQATGAHTTGTAALTDLSNIASTAVSATLLPATAGSAALGSNAKPWGNGFFGTVANQAASLNTANVTTNRVINVPNATSTPVRDCPAVADQVITALAVATGVCTQAQLALANLSDGATVATSSSTNTFTNKTLNQEGSGNVVTTVSTLYFDSAGCNNSTAGPSFDLMPTNAPNPVCLTGSNTQQGALAYDDSANEFGQVKFALPHTWVGNIDINLYWDVTTGGGSNAVKWTVATACSTAGATYDTAFNSAQTITTNVSANNLITVSTQNTVTVTGCSVDSLMHFKIGRDTTDTSTATANLIGAKIILRKTGS